MAEANVDQQHTPDLEDNLTWKHKVGYGAGDCGGVITLAFIQGYLNRYVTNILGVGFETLSVLLLIWNIWDMVNDPLMGGLMDKAFGRAKSGQDKFRPWILRSIPLIVFGLIAFCTVPGMFQGMLRVAMIFLLKIIYEFGYTMMNIAMGSILGVMATNDTERTSLSSARGMGSTVGNLTGAILIPAILARVGETAFGYAVAGTTCAVLGGLLVYLHYLWTEERNEAAKAMADQQEEEAKLTDIFVTIRENRAFLALVIHSIVIVFGQNMVNLTNPYIYADVYGDIGLMTLASAVGQGLPLILLAISPKLVQRIGSTVDVIKTYLLISIVLYVALAITMAVTDISSYTYLFWSNIAFAFMMMSVQLQWGLVSESIDYNEYLTGKRSEGTIYGNFSLTRRLGQVIAQSLGVLMIGWAGYDQAAANAGQAQAQSTINSLIGMNVILPAVSALLSYLSFRFIWNIDDELRGKIAAKRNAAMDEALAKQKNNNN